MRRGPRPARISLISLGCPRTLVDSEVYLGRLRAAGFELVDAVEGSDAVIINTCGFIQEAIQESVDTVLQAIELKKRGRLKAVLVAGCLVQRYKDQVIRELPEVDGFVGVDAFSTIDAIVARALAGQRATDLRRRPQVPHRGGRVPRAPLTPSHYAYLKISEGCLKGCRFCVIPRIKGPLSSRPMDEVVDEARQLVEERGVTELIVVGQDTSDYGVDRYGGPRIAPLLRRLAAIRGVTWIRLLYCHPHGIDQALIETIRDEPAICKYLDMAIEHADDRVLRRMNRLTTRQELRDRIGSLRHAMPGIALRTSVIVGFPGETDEEFEQLLAFLREIRFERLGAFTFSREEGTAAFRDPNQVPKAVAQARFARLMTLQREIAAAVTARWVGSIRDVVIDEPVPDAPTQFLGRTSADCPEVDGVVYVQSDRLLHPGQYVPVRLRGSYEYDLVGSVVAEQPVHPLTLDTVVSRVKGEERGAYSAGSDPDATLDTRCQGWSEVEATQFSV